MAITIQMRDGLIETTFRGSIAVAEIIQQLKDLEDLESGFEVTPNRIVDLSDATDSNLTSSDLVAFAQRRRDAKLKNKIKTAIIAPKPVQYGVARIYMAFNQKLDSEIRVFRDSASAHSWLSQVAQPAINTRAQANI